MRIASIETIGFNQFDKNDSVVGEILTSTVLIISSFSKKCLRRGLNVFAKYHVLFAKRC